MEGIGILVGVERWRRGGEGRGGEGYVRRDEREEGMDDVGDEGRGGEGTREKRGLMMWRDDSWAEGEDAPNVAPRAQCGLDLLILTTLNPKP